MTGEYWKTREITTEERERDELREGLGINSEEHKAKDLEVRNLTSKLTAEILKQNVTTAKGEKDMWSILRSLSTHLACQPLKS